MRRFSDKRLLATGGLLLSIALFLLPPAWGAGYTEVFHSGKVDWSKGSAEAVGTTVIGGNDKKSEKARAAAAEEAVNAARANLLDLVGRIKVNSNTAIKDLLQQSEPLGSKVRDMVASVTSKGVRFGSDGRVEATVSMALAGPLSEMILPQAITAIASVQANNSNPEKEAFTWVVVDCSGLRLRPALFPTIVDEEGQLVYGAPHIHRDHAVKRGVAVYTRNVDAAEIKERAGVRPLIIKGIRVAASGPSDIVVSNSDAGKLKSSAHNLKLLQGCRVMIILE